MIFKTLVPSTKKIFMTIIVLNILAILAYSSMFLGLKKKNETHSVLMNELSGQNSRETQLRLVDNNLGETEMERRKLNSYLVHDGDSGVAEFMDDIENVSNLANISMEVNSILLKNQGYEEEKGIVEDMKLNLKAEGDWYDIIYFLRLVELMPYKISFDRVYLEKKDILSEKSSQWTALFNINVLKLSNN